MAKMYFPSAVKYNGVKHPANTPFEVADKDVDSLKKAGGWVVETAKTVEEKAVEPKTAAKKPGKAKAKEAK